MANPQDVFRFPTPLSFRAPFRTTRPSIISEIQPRYYFLKGFPRKSTMKINVCLAPLLLAACSLAAYPAAAATGDIVVRNVKTTVLVDLAPTPDAPASAVGSAKIKIHQINATQTALLKLQIEGFTAGKY